MSLAGRVPRGGWLRAGGGADGSASAPVPAGKLSGAQHPEGEELIQGTGGPRNTGGSRQRLPDRSPQRFPHCAGGEQARQVPRGLRAAPK